MHLSTSRWHSLQAGGGEQLSGNDIAAIEAENARRVLDRVKSRLTSGVVNDRYAESLDDPVELTLAVCSGDWTPIIGGKTHWFVHRLPRGIQWSIADNTHCERLRNILGLCAQVWSV